MNLTCCRLLQLKCLTSVRVLRLVLFLLLIALLPRQGGAEMPTGWSTGGKSILIIPVAFTDCAAPIGPVGGWTNLLSDIDQYYRHQSYSNYWISSYTIMPAVNLGVSYTNYKPYHQWQDNAFLPDIRAKAKLAGYDTDDFDVEIVHTFMPLEATNGIAVRGKGMHLNFPNTDPRMIPATPHELGHNLGLFHNRGASSASYLPGPGPYQNAGYWMAEYGGYFDLMGSSDFSKDGLGEFCAPYKNWLGWLPDANVANASTSGTFRIHAFDQGAVIPGNGYALKIDLDQEYTFWGEFRQAVTNNEWSMNGLGLYWGSESLLSGGRYACQLDMTPGSQGVENPGSRNSTGQNMGDAPLALGRTYSDANRNVHITPVRKGGTSPESLDVVVQYGPFPGNRAPLLSIAATTLVPVAGQMVTFTATASDPDGDTLAYYWEFDDPNAPAGAGLRPFGLGSPDPDASLRTTASYSWPSNCHVMARCTVTDMKGGRTIVSASVTVGGGAGYTATGVVRDELGNPVAGAIVNNYKGAIPFSATNFVASGETASNGLYVIQLRNGTTNHLFARHEGHIFQCSVPGGSTTGTVIIAGASVTNVNFARVRSTRIIGGPVYLAGAYPKYNPSIHGPMTVQGGTNVVSVDTNGYWSMAVPEGPIDLTFSLQPGHVIRYGFRNPFEVVETLTNLATFVNITNAAVSASVEFLNASGSSDDAVGTLAIPFVLRVPAGYTNATWPMSQWLGGILGGQDTAQYGVDYRVMSMEYRFAGGSGVFTNTLRIKILPNGATHSRTLSLKMEPLNVGTHLGANSSYTHAILAAGADGDSDGMPDEWEWLHSKSLTNVLAGADDDGDGMPNGAEYESDTDPASSNSVLVITGVRSQAEGVWLDWKGGFNAMQVLETRTDLGNGEESWIPVGTNYPPTLATTNWFHPDASATSRYYRIRALR
jgi:hypothetical protein